MARFTIELPAAPKGGRYVLEMEQEQAPVSNAPTGMREKLAAMEKPTVIDRSLSKLPGGNLRGSAVGGYMMGAADISVGAAQLAANAVGQGESINNAIAAKEAEYQDRRAAAGRDGFDGARLVGNVAGPGLLAGGVGAGMGATARGATQGAIGGAAQPVTDGGDSFAADKAIQTGLGALAGGAAGKLFDSLANTLSSFVGKMRAQGRTVDPAAVEAQVNFALQKDGIDVSAIPKNILASVRSQVEKALRNGEQIDPAALARKMDFEALGMQGTKGQITRDPSQFAREKNMSGVEDAGEALTRVFSEQPRQLAGKLDELGAGNANEAVVDGAALQDRLLRNDQFNKKLVSRAYDKARESGENALDVPMKQLSQAFGEMRGRLDMNLLPGTVKSRLQSYGLMDGKQTKAFTLDDAQDLIKTINANYDPANLAQARALDIIRRSVNQDVDSVASSVGGGASLWRDAAKLASERFKGIESLPALRAVTKGEAPDKFVQKYIIGADARDLSSLKALVGESPEASQLVRNQVVMHLKNKAFGADSAGDKSFAQASFNKELQKIGRTRLSEIFSPAEVDTLFRIGRVSAYAGSAPAGAVVNSSGTGAMVMNLMSKMGKIPYLREVGIKPIENALARREAADAASGVIPTEKLPFNSPSVDRVRNRLASPVALGAGAMATPRQER